MKKLNLIFTVIFVVIIFLGYDFSQDATKVDPNHYKVEFENDQVRVLRINYGPGEKSVMHSHPDGIIVYLTDGEKRIHFPDGTTRDLNVKAGQVVWSPKKTHQPENIGENPFELIQIELKKK